MGMIAVLAALAWWGICLGQWEDPHMWWSRATELWGMVSWRGIVTRGLAGALVHHAAILVLAAAGALAFAGLGGPVESIARPRDAAAWERRSLRVILGFAVLGFSGFAAALCGLAFAPLFWAVAAAGLVMPGARGLAAAAARAGIPWPGEGRWVLALALVPVLPVAAVMLMPDGHVDVLTYHLAIPEQVLRVHKFTGEGACVATGFPLAAEFVYAIPVAIGRDELAHWLQAAPFLASVVLLAGWAARRAGTGAGWAAAAAVLTCGAANQQLTVAKNDLAAAAFTVAGAVGIARGIEAGGKAGMRGWMALSGLLFGAGCGVKFNAGILAAVALVCLLPVGRLRRAIPWWLGLAALPALPWLVRSWLWFGDPLWPALSAWWPGAWWRPEDARSVVIARGHGTILAALRDLVGEAGGFLWRDMPPVALALPFLMFGRSADGGSGRWLLGFAALSTAACAVMMRSEWSRLAAPSLFLVAAVAAPACASALSGRRPWVRRAAMLVAAASCWLPLGYFFGAWVPGVPTVPYLAGIISRDECRAQRLTTLDDAFRRARALPNPSGRMILLGEIRTYGIPARVPSQRNYGASWGWDLAKVSSSRERIRIRVRQLGIRWIMHNFITEGYPHPIVEPYAWDDRMIAVWRSFVELDLELAVPAPGVDNLNGGFCFWRLRPVPAPVRPPYLPYLPGLDSLYNSIVSRRNVNEWLAAALEVDRRVPNVDFIRDRISQAYYVLQDWSNVLKWVAPSITHGTVDDANCWHAAVAYAVFGKWDESERMTARAIEVKPEIAKAAAELRDRVKRLRERGKDGGAVPGLFPSQ